MRRAIVHVSTFFLPPSHFLSSLPSPPFVGGGITISHTDGGRRKGKKESRSRYKFNIAPSSFCCHLTRRRCETERGRQKKGTGRTKSIWKSFRSSQFEKARALTSPRSPRKEKISVLNSWRAPGRSLITSHFCERKKRALLNFPQTPLFYLWLGQDIFLFCMRDRCVWFF